MGIGAILAIIVIGFPGGIAAIPDMLRPIRRADA